MAVADSTYCRARAIMEESGDQVDANTAEVLADLAFEIGKALRASGEVGAAVMWAERCCDILGGNDMAASLSQDASELRLSAMNLLSMLVQLSKEDAGRIANDDFSTSVYGERQRRGTTEGRQPGHRYGTCTSRVDASSNTS